MNEHYERGMELGKTIQSMRDEGIDYDARWDIAYEAKSLSKEDFKEFMNGLNAAFESA